MGEVYLSRIKQWEYGHRLVEALEIIARPKKHLLVFHCLAGKDRSGVLAAIILSTLGVGDQDIIRDYTLTAPYMKALLERFNSDPNTPDDILNLPAYTWEATPESMEWFLSAVKREYGSLRGYLEKHGARKSLFGRMETALLI
jgi:protein-tyrosine phosphatase